MCVCVCVCVCVCFVGAHIIQAHFAEIENLSYILCIPICSSTFTIISVHTLLGSLLLTYCMYTLSKGCVYT